MTNFKYIAQIRKLVPSSQPTTVFSVRVRLGRFDDDDDGHWSGFI